MVRSKRTQEFIGRCDTMCRLCQLLKRCLVILGERLQIDFLVGLFKKSFCDISDDFESSIQIDSADDSLECIGEQRGFLASPVVLFGRREVDEIT